MKLAVAVAVILAILFAACSYSPYRDPYCVRVAAVGTIDEAPIDQAIDTWNAYCGSKILYRTCPPGEYTANFMVFGDAGPSPPDASAADGGIECGHAAPGVGGDMYFKGGCETMEYEIALHELGHVLGLGHKEGTPMAPYLTKTYVFDQRNELKENHWPCY
jgi:hypothetical protein